MSRFPCNKELAGFNRSELTQLLQGDAAAPKEGEPAAPKEGEPAAPAESAAPEVNNAYDM